MNDATLVVGCMTGTSIDALDAALVRVRGEGLELECALQAAESWPLGALAPRLRDAAEQRAMTSGEFARLAHDFGKFHAECLGGWLGGLGITPDLVVVHGQTVFHQPPVSWQLINPAPIAARLGAPVVFDLRQADLAAGGQGAPITPMADAVLYRGAGPAYAVINLGGFCNLTIIDRRGGEVSVRGRDVCACNQVIDAAARAGLGVAFDEDGRAALRGRADERAGGELMAILAAQSGGGRSLGTGDESGAWAARWARTLPGEDLAATACAAVGACIDSALPLDIPAAIVAGGGVRNRALMRELARHSRVPIRPSDELGIPASYREAAAMAVLGEWCRQGVPITVPGVTGCSAPAPVSGHWVRPGRG